MKSNARGFTLLELMTAVTVLAVLLGLAVPSFREVSRNNRVTAAQNDLVTAFTYARSEALRLSQPVSVCATEDAATCSGAENWATGWIAFIDSGATPGEVDEEDANERVLQAWAATNTSMTLAGSTPYVQYGPTGMTIGAAAETFDVYATGCHGRRLRQVALTAIGSLSSTTQNCP